ncbi:MAG: Sua5/YciO/YrdC/YwlC family protein, partial [Victivallaceae bacterium]
SAIMKLRLFKQRQTKPLALMAVNLPTVQKYFQLSDIELNALTSPAAPLVILNLKADFTQYNPQLLAPDAPDNLAVMLPASGLHYLLMAEFDKEFVVASSCNLRGEATALEAEELAHYPAGFIDGILTHPRKIYFRHDDSLLAANGGVMQIWRRARGFKWAALAGTLDETPILALGSEMKNTFSVSGNGDLLLSPHHGSLDSVTSMRSWERALEQTLDSLSRRPAALAVDLNCHNNIGRYGEKLALPIIKVQHHYAHARAAAAELRMKEGIILVWDGTGLGSDGTIWGSEFFRLKHEDLELLASFSASALPGGELAIKHPARQLAARMVEQGASAAEIGKFCPNLTEFELQMIIKMVQNKFNSIQSRGAGRLFDAFAARLGIAPELIDYEGEAAVRLESAARGQKKLAAAAKISPYSYQIKRYGGGWKLDFSSWFAPDFELGELAAWRFHYSLAVAAADLTGRLATPGSEVALCGGVFQNRLLTELLGRELQRNNFIMRLPEQIPPNDGGIAVGQLLEAK